MRGLDLLIVYVLSNDKARQWCWKKVKEASLAIDQTFRNTTVGKAFFPDKGDKNDDCKRPKTKND